MKYICKETFQLDMYDENGFFEEREMTVHQGAMFERIETNHRLIGGQIRLEGITADEGTWLEVSAETLDEYFEEVKEYNNETDIHT